MADQGPLPFGAEPITTGCGRRIAVHCLRFGAQYRPIGRVTLRVGPEETGTPGIWAALTPAEARDLAWRLFEQAALAEGALGWPGGAAAG